MKKALFEPAVVHTSGVGTTMSPIAFGYRLTAACALIGFVLLAASRNARSEAVHCKMTEGLSLTGSGN